MGLKYLAVGTGRDGTLSLTHLINDMFTASGSDAVAAHEYLATECYDAYCLYKETGEQRHLDQLRDKIRDCPYDAVIGNGYAPVLGIFREVFPDLALIHLKRKDRAALIQSHIQISRLFPDSYIDYEAVHGTKRRIAAFHEGDMSRDAWNTLSLEDKFGWFYDYTHGQVEAEHSRFARSINIETELLSDKGTLDRLSAFISGDVAMCPNAVHLNRLTYLAVSDFSESNRPYAQWLFGTLSASDIERDHVYLANYVTGKFITLAGYQITGVVRDVAPAYALGQRKILEALSRFEALTQERLKEVRLLKAEIRSRHGCKAAINRGIRRLIRFFLVPRRRRMLGQPGGIQNCQPAVPHGRKPPGLIAASGCGPRPKPNTGR
jgi:hypothetical protein